MKSLRHYKPKAVTSKWDNSISYYLDQTEDLKGSKVIPPVYKLRAAYTRFTL